MIKVIKSGKKEIKMYKVTCHECYTVFTCDENDMHKVCFGHGEFADAVTCPVCENDCTAWYSIDEFEQI